jgi:uncharacterized cupredoxin-like copper-binding protein
MLHLRTLTAAVLAGTLLVAGCSLKQAPKPTTPPAGQTTEPNKPQRPELTAPIEGALKALAAMNEAGKQKDIPGAQAHHVTFRSHWKTVQAALDPIDPKLAVHIENGAEELDIEFRKPADQFRFYELDEEAVKLGRLLSQAANLLGAPIDQSLVQKDPTMDIPFNKEQRIAITLSDHKIEPSAITLEQHTKVTFVITNKGHEVHEFALDHYAVEVEEIMPGETKELTLTVLDAGEFETACYLPGHYEVGMYGTLTVTPAELKAK